MFSILQSGGLLMLPILLCSVIAVAIILERSIALRRSRIIPKKIVHQINLWVRKGELDEIRIAKLRSDSALGQILAAGLVNRFYGHAVIKESIEDTGKHVVHDLERYLNTLGTIAAITPLLGLLGTVIGMIDVFAVITSVGVGDANLLAGGISKALITTAAGISVAIPALVFYRIFRGKVDSLVTQMERESLKMLEIVIGDRDPNT